MQSSLSLRKASWPPILINRLHFLPDYTRLGTFFGGKGLFYRPVHAVVVVCWLFVFCLFVCFLIFFLSVCLFVCLLLFLKKCNGSMTQNKLQLDQEKTQALLIDPQNSPNLPLSIKIGQNDFFFLWPRSVWNLGVISDDKLSMKPHVSKTCQSAYWNCVEFAQLDMFSQSMLPEPL